MSERVVITGYGLMTSLGESAQENWHTLCSPSQNRNISHFRGQSPEVRLNGYLKAREMVDAAIKEALLQSGLWDGRSLQNVGHDRVGCTISASKPLASDDNQSWIEPDAINTFAVERYGVRGESRNVVAACATGAYSAALGAMWIEQDLCDVVICGSVEPSPHPLMEAGFRQMGVVSKDGQTKPFDAHRTGFTFGEGAGVVILESETHAKARGAKPLAQLSGWAMGADTHSAYAFNSNGAKIAGVIRRAVSRAGLAPKDIRHVNAHGTATRSNDRMESQALEQAFGPHAERLMISATKASTGHLLGASGSVELVLTLMALKHQFVPPTRTLETPDKECPLDYTPRQGHAASFDHALSLSFGFGGPIGVLAVSSL